MENIKLAKSANYESGTTWCTRNKQLSKALDTLSELLGIEFGSLTVRFHQGKWSPKIEIEKKLVEEIKK